MKRQTSIRISQLTDSQIRELAELWGMTQTQVIELAVDRARREEMKIIVVRNDQELTDALTSLHLTPTPLPTLPVEVAGVRIVASDEHDRQECESCAVAGEHVAANTTSTNPEWSGYNLCEECAQEYNGRPPVNSASA